jgi:hypothetical protein
VGICDGLSNEQIKQKFPEEHKARIQNKLNYRFPRLDDDHVTFVVLCLTFYHLPLIVYLYTILYYAILYYTMMYHMCPCLRFVNMNDVTLYYTYSTLLYCTIHPVRTGERVTWM